MLRHRSIRSRIIVLVIVPVIALVGLYVAVLNLTLGNLLTLRNEAAIHQILVLPVADVQNHVGKERTLALAYLARPNKPTLAKLLVAEHRTDQSIRKFRATVQTALKAGPVPKERQALIAWQTSLGSMNGLRTSVVSIGISRSQAAIAYSAKFAGGDNVLNQAILPVLTGPLGIQATDLLTMARSAQTQGEESGLIRADLIAHSFPPTDLALIQRLAVEHQDFWDQTLPDLDPNLASYFRTVIPQTASRQLAVLETDVLSGHSTARRVPLGVWTSAETSYQRGFLSALLKSAAVLANEATAQADGLVLHLILIAVLGLLAIGIAIAVAVVLGRGLARQLSDLRASAVALSTAQLPSAILRLRAGEELDVGTEVPQLEAGSDEIGQVRQAFNAAARTAIAAAVDEVAIRRGVNEVFRNLARRNQSLLTRQLQLLDSMERRVHDPEELADLFRVDHLTTRMRRHAEGLLIVAGGSSGRTWREPVPVVDVMRAAVAEVEDYTRIRVTSRTSAAIAGHAVADIIHLLAELVENAATFSPAHTPVRIDGDKVARGVVIEIEDRGLGMGDGQFARINTTLEDPPLFDLSGSDQLGLFITGQLAKRHDIRVSLRESPYGGVIAVVLIPAALVIDAGMDESGELPAIASIRQLGGRPVPQLPAAAAILSKIDIPIAASEDAPAEDDQAVELPAANLPSTDLPSTDRPGTDLPGTDLPARTPAATLPAMDWPAATRTDLPAARIPATDLPAARIPATDLPAARIPATDLPAARIPATDLPAARIPATDLPAARIPATDLPAARIPATDLPAGRIPAAGLAAAAAAGFAVGRGEPRAQPATGGWPLPDFFGANAARSTPLPPAGALEAEPDTAEFDTAGFSGMPLGPRPTSTGPASTGPASTGPASTRPASTGPTGFTWPSSEPEPPVASPAPAAQPLAQAASLPVNSGLAWNENGIGPASQEPEDTAPGDLIELDGLPMRVRQASLAPQLKRQPVTIGSDQHVPAPEASGADEPSDLPSPEAARNTMAALQLGWQRGRSESASADGEPPSRPGPPSSGDQPAAETGGSQ